MDNEPKKDKSLWRWILEAVILALIGLCVYFVQAKINSKSSASSKEGQKINTVNSGVQTNVDSARDVFENNGSGQQYNNPGSGTQTINNPK